MVYFCLFKFVPLANEEVLVIVMGFVDTFQPDFANISNKIWNGSREAISPSVPPAPPALEEALNFACDKRFPFSLSDGADLMDFLCPLLKVSK